MAIDREAARKKLDEQKQKRGNANIRFLPKDKVVNLRVLEFTDEEGKQQFARTVVQFRKPGFKKGDMPIINRQMTFGATCAAERLIEMASAANEDSPFQREQTVYLVNGIDLDHKPHEVKIWQIPTTVWEILAEHACSDEWPDVFEQESGHSFAMSRSGSGLETEYSAQVGRKPVPISDELMAQVKDPFEVCPDIGLEAQCKLLGVEISDLWDDTSDLEIEPVVIGKKTKAAKAPSAGKASKKVTKKATSKKAEPEEPQLGLGVRVAGKVGEDWYPGVIKAEKESGWEIKFDDGDVLVIENEDDIRLLEEEAPAEDPPEPEEKGYVPAKGHAGEGLFAGNGEWYSGRITSVNKDGTITVTFDDGDSATLDPETEWKPNGGDGIPFDSDAPPMVVKGGKSGASKIAGRLS